MFKIFSLVIIGAVGAGAAYHTIQSQKAADLWEMEKEATKLMHEVKLLKFRVERRGTIRNPERYEALVKETGENGGRLERVSVEHENLLREVAKLEGDFNHFRETRLAELRHRAQGRQWDRFVTKSGRVLKEVQVVSVEDGGVMLRHQDGSLRMGYPDLTDEQQALFGMEEEASRLAVLRDHRKEVAYHEWLEGEVRLREDLELYEQLKQTLASKAPARFINLPARSLPAAGPQGGTAPASTSPLQLKSLSAPPQKFGENARRIYRNGSSVKYYQVYDPTAGQMPIRVKRLDP